MDDLRLNKAAIIERCVARIREEYALDERNLYENYTKQDSIILNIQRACEAAIDLAMHEVRFRRLGVPQESREAFSLLYKAGLLPKELTDHMMAMVGFRNIAVHDYQDLNLDIVKQIVEKNLGDFLDFAKIMIKKE